MTDRAAYARHYALAHSMLKTNYAAVAARFMIEGKGAPNLDDLASEAHAAAMLACKREDEQFGPDEIEVRQLKRDLVDAEKAAQSYERVVGGSVERLANILWAADDLKRPNLDEIGLDDPELWESVFAALDANMVDACRTVSAQRDELDTAKRRVHDLHDQLESLLWSTLQPGEDGRPASDAASELREQAITAEVGRLMGWTGQLAEQLEGERSRHAAELAVATREARRLLDIARRSSGEHALVPHDDLTDEEVAQALSCACPGGKDGTVCSYVHVASSRLRERSKEAAALRVEVHDHEDRQALSSEPVVDTARDEKLAEQTASGVWLSDPTTLAAVL